MPDTTYMLAHPESEWGKIEFNMQHYNEGYDLVAIRPNGVFVYIRRGLFIRIIRKLFPRKK